MGLGRLYRQNWKFKVFLPFVFFVFVIISEAFPCLLLLVRTMTWWQLRFACLLIVWIPLHVSDVTRHWWWSSRKSNTSRCLSRWQYFVDRTEFGHRTPSAFSSLTFLSEIESCPLKEWACDSSCIFLLMFINWRLEYLLHGDTSRRCYGLYNKYLLSVFYNLVNFIYPLYPAFQTGMFTDS